MLISSSMPTPIFGGETLDLGSLSTSSATRALKRFTDSSSAAVTSVVALGTSTEAPFTDSLELLTVISVVVVYVVEDVERTAALG